MFVSHFDIYIYPLQAETHVRMLKTYWDNVWITAYRVTGVAPPNRGVGGGWGRQGGDIEKGHPYEITESDRSS